MRIETPVAISYVKRFYFAEGGRGCSLTFEAREDVFPRASRWADFIASTLRFGGAGGRGEVSAALGPARRRPRPPPRRARPAWRSSVGPRGPGGRLRHALGRTTAPGRSTTRRRAGPACARPSPSYYLYAVLPEAFRRRAPGGALASRSSTSAPATASSACSTPRATAPMPWRASTRRPSSAGAGGGRASSASGAPLFHLPDFDPARTQNLGASFRFEFRRELLVAGSRVSLAPPADLARFPAMAPAARAAQAARAASTRSTTCSSRSRTPATSSAPGAPTRSWTAGAAS